MSAASGSRRLAGTVLALAAAGLIWIVSGAVVDWLGWRDLLPLVRLGAIVAGVTALDRGFAALCPLFVGRGAAGDSEGAGQ